MERWVTTGNSRFSSSTLRAADENRSSPKPPAEYSPSLLSRHFASCLPSFLRSSNLNHDLGSIPTTANRQCRAHRKRRQVQSGASSKPYRRPPTTRRTTLSRLSGHVGIAQNAHCVDRGGPRDKNFGNRWAGWPYRRENQHPTHQLPILWQNHEFAKKHLCDVWRAYETSTSV